MTSLYAGRVFTSQRPYQLRAGPAQVPSVNAAPRTWFDVSLGDLPANANTDAQAAQASSPALPPPSYAGSQAPRQPSAGLPLSRTVSSGRTVVAAPARRSVSCTVKWAYHPSLSGNRLSRLLSRHFRYLHRDPEMLSSAFPEEFEELLLESGLMERETDKVKELYMARINHLNDWVIPDCLIITRLWMALLEIIVVAIVALFIAALVVTGGRQEGLMQGAEVSLIVVILLAGMFINHVRIRRWTLRHMLRTLSRDWSPLPASTNAAAASVIASLHASLGVSDPERAAALRNREDGLKPSMRWTMHKKEGGWWTSWRPVIMVELLVPASVPPPPHPGGEDFVPTYSPRHTPGERIVQFSE